MGVQASSIDGTGWARVQLNTKDPALLTLATTTNLLQWTYNGSTVGYVWHTDMCWAANPSPLNTHWYKTFCSNNAPTNSNNNRDICNWAIGDYKNWDFGNVNLTTEAHHWTKLCGQSSGKYTYEIQYWDAGEFSAIIYHTVKLN